MKPYTANEGGQHTPWAPGSFLEQPRWLCLNLCMLRVKQSIRKRQKWGSRQGLSIWYLLINSLRDILCACVSLIVCVCVCTYTVKVYKNSYLFIFCVWVSVLICMMGMWVPGREKEAIRSSEAGVWTVLGPAMESNSCPLREQQALLITELSLQPQTQKFLLY